MNRYNFIVSSLKRCGLTSLAKEFIEAGRFAVKNPWLEKGMVCLTINKKKYCYEAKRGFGGGKKVIEDFKILRRNSGVGKALAWLKTVTILKKGGKRKVI